MATKEEIMEFAEELYLYPDEKGNHKYTLREISAEIQQKFSKKIHNTTILNWARKYGWDKKWESSVKQGLTQALAETLKKQPDSKKSVEEQLDELIQKNKQQNFVMNNNLKVWAYNYIRENGFSNTSEALRAYELGMKFTNIEEEERPIFKGNVINIYADNPQDISRAVRELAERLINKDDNGEL